MTYANLRKGAKKRRPPERRLQIDKPKHVDYGLVEALKRMVLGRGMEFDGYREFVPDVDSAADIDWKASMRSNKMLAKILKRENTLKVLFVLDGGSTMLFASKDKLKVEYAASIIASLAYGIVLADEKVGLLIFSDKIKFYSAPRPGRHQYHRIMEALSDPNNYGGRSDMVSAMKHTMLELPDDAIVIVISDFLKMPDAWAGALSITASKLDVLGLMVRDPRDIEMPKDYVGPIVIEDPHTGDNLFFQPEEIKDEYAQIAQQQAKKAKDTFITRRASLAALRTDEEFTKPLIKFFRGMVTG